MVRVLGDRYRCLIKENGTHGALGVLWVYSRRSVGILAVEVELVWWIVAVGWVMCMDRNVRVNVCSHVSI